MCERERSVCMFLMESKCVCACKVREGERGSLITVLATRQPNA